MRTSRVRHGYDRGLSGSAKMKRRDVWDESLSPIPERRMHIARIQTRTRAARHDSFIASASRTKGVCRNSVQGIEIVKLAGAERGAES